MMIEISGDNGYEIKKLREVLEEWCGEKGIEIKIYEFLEEKALLVNKGSLDTVFVDMQLVGFTKNEISEKIREKNIKEVLSNERKKVKKELVLNIARGMEKFPVKEIIYFEKIARKIFVHTRDSQRAIHGTLKKIYDQLDQNQFVYCHQGCIVNLNYIKKFSCQEIVMIDNSEKKLARPRVKDFKNAYMNFTEKE